MEDLWRVRLTCEMGDYMEADWETCKRGHGLLYMTFDCACQSCYFHGKPAYSEDPEKVGQPVRNKLEFILEKFIIKNLLTLMLPEKLLKCRKLPKKVIILSNLQ